MRLSRRHFGSIAAATLGGVALGEARAAAGYPARPLRVVVGSAAGSSPDIIVRTVTAEMARRLQQTIVVDNHPGASTAIATSIVARSPADGYTLGYATPSFVLNRALKLPLALETDRDVQPVGQLGFQPVVLVANGALPFNDALALAEHARSHPGTLNYASTGPGSILHLVALLFGQSTHTDFNHVPYSSALQAISDLIAGRVDFMFNPINVVLPHIRSGLLKPLGVTSLTRSPVLPTVPTLTELKIDGVEAVTWGGMVAPAGVPRNIVDLLNASMNASLAAPAVFKSLNESGYEIVGGSATQFGRYIHAELDKWQRVIDHANPPIH